MDNDANPPEVGESPEETVAAPVNRQLKKSPLEKIRDTIAAGPLPAAASKIEASYRTHRRQIWIGLVLTVLLIAIAIGLGFGERIARLFRPSLLEVPELPRVTPTPLPQVSTSFDQLRLDVRDFSGNLPDPAPPAVDHNISLEN